MLIHCGLFMYTKDTKEPRNPGRLRLLYEASPMAMVVEQAGGAVSTGEQRILDLVPTELHQRVPLILGAKNEVERLVQYHGEHSQALDRTYSSPVSHERSLLI